MLLQPIINKTTGKIDPSVYDTGATPYTIDQTPVEGSVNLVESGGIYDALKELEDKIPQKTMEILHTSGVMDYSSADGAVVCRLEIDNMLVTLSKDGYYCSFRIQSLDGSLITINTSSVQYYSAVGQEINNEKLSLSGTAYHEFDTNVGYGGGTIGSVLVQRTDTGKEYVFYASGSNTSNEIDRSDKYSLAIMPLDNTIIRISEPIEKNDLPSDIVYYNNIDAKPIEKSANLVMSSGIWNDTHYKAYGDPIQKTLADVVVGDDLSNVTLNFNGGMGTVAEFPTITFSNGQHIGFRSSDNISWGLYDGDSILQEWAVTGGMDSGTTFTFGNGFTITSVSDNNPSSLISQSITYSIQSQPDIIDIEWLYNAINNIENSTIDSVPTEDSVNLVKSGGVYDAIQESLIEAKDYIDLRLPENAIGIYDVVGDLDPTSANGSVICRLEVDNMLFTIVKNNNYGSFYVQSLDGNSITLNVSMCQYYDGGGVEARHAKTTLSGSTSYRFDDNVGYGGKSTSRTVIQDMDSGTQYEAWAAGMSTTTATDRANRFSLAILPLKSVVIRSNRTISKNDLPSDIVYFDNVDAVPTESSPNLVASGGVYDADQQTLIAANSYTDQKLTEFMPDMSSYAEISYVDGQDTQTLVAAKDYADTIVGALDVQTFQVVNEYDLPYVSGNPIVLNSTAVAVIFAFAHDTENTYTGKIKCHLDENGRLVVDDELEDGSLIDVSYFVGLGSVSGGGTSIDYDLITSRVLDYIDINAIISDLENRVGIDYVDYLQTSRELRIYLKDGSYKSDILPLATVINDGLMAKEDKQTINTLQTKVNSLELGGMWQATFDTVADMLIRFPSYVVDDNSYTINDFVYVEVDENHDGEQTSYILQPDNTLVFRRVETTPIRMATDSELGVIKGGGDASINSDGTITIPYLAELDIKNNEQDNKLNIIETSKFNWVDVPDIGNYSTIKDIAIAMGQGMWRIPNYHNYPDAPIGDDDAITLMLTVNKYPTTGAIILEASVAGIQSSFYKGYIESTAHDFSGWEIYSSTSSLCNPNMVINGDFMHNPINQRGLTVYPQTELSNFRYTLDMVRTTGPKIEIMSDHIVASMDNTPRTGWPSVISPIEGIFRANETYTISGLFEVDEIIPLTFGLRASSGDGAPSTDNGYSEIWQNPIEPGGKLLMTKTFTLSQNQTNPILFLNCWDNISSAGSIKIYAWKLEKGTVSTLLNETPEPIASKLAKCQRYFVSIRGYASSSTVDVPIANLSCIERTNQVHGKIQLPVTMRNSPSITVDGTPTDIMLYGITSTGFNQSIPVTVIDVLGNHTNGVYVRLDTTETLVLGNIYYLFGLDGCNLFISAEL